jgi:hypothetical protein
MYEQFVAIANSLRERNRSSEDAADTQPDGRVLEQLLGRIDAVEGDAILGRLIRSHPVFGSTFGKGKKTTRAGCATQTVAVPP